MDEQKTLAASSIFSRLDPLLLEQMVAKGELRTVTANTSLFCLGDQYVGEVYIVLSGAVQVQRRDGQAYAVTVGDFVGLSGYLDRAPYSSTAFCPGEVVLLVISEDLFQELKGDFPDLSHAVNRSLANRLRRWSPERRESSGPLMQKVRSAMTTPFAACDESISLFEALALMRTRKIETLGVVDGEGALKGLVSPALIADLVVLHQTPSATALSAVEIEAVQTISPESQLWHAEQLLLDHGRDCLAVVEGDQPVGMLCQSDIARLYSMDTQRSLMTSRAAKSTDVGELGQLATTLVGCARDALENNRRPLMAVRILSEAHLTLSRRCVELTLEQMQRDGYGPAPADYAFLIMGSGGRREMLLAPDQDNGLILVDEAESDETVRRWFELFADRVNLNLAAIGYPLCPGEIMARNPMYRKTLSEWKRQLSYIADFPTEKAARWSNVVFDFDTLYGDDSLAIALRDHLHTELGEKRRLLTMMVEDDAEGRAPIGFFNRLITTDEKAHKGQIDVKRNGLRLIADAARIYAMSRGVKSCSTIDRISALVRIGQLDADFADSIISAYGELMSMVLDHQLDQLLRGEAPDRMVEPAAMTARQREVLRDSMLAVKRFQEKLQGDFARISF